MLTQKQKIFIKEYLLDQNATAAAIRAGYSYKSAGKIGHQLLEKTRISVAIEKELKNRMDKLEIKSESITQELAKIAFFDVSEILKQDSSGNFCFKHISQWPSHSASVVKSISHTKNGLNIQFYSKIDALELLGEHLGLWQKAEDSNKNQQARRLEVIERVKNILANRINKDSK